MLAGVAAAVRLLACLAGLAALAAHHGRGILVLVLVLVATVAVTVATVTGINGHLYIYLTFLLRIYEKIKGGHIFNPSV